MTLAALSLLAAAQYLALFFFYSAVPAVLRQSGAPLELLGFFGLAYAAFALSFLWAPFVDRLHVPSLGRRRSWFLAMQGLALLCTATAALFDPSRHAIALLVLAVLASLAAATQRIATLGYAVESLPPEKHAWGSTAIGWGGALGLLLGGSAMLVVVESLGWTAACLVLAATIIVMAVLLLLLKEPQAPIQGRDQRPSLLACIKRRGTRRVFAIVLPLAFAKGVAFTLMQPRLVDLGVALSDVALAVGLANAAGFMVIGPLVSKTLPRVPLDFAFRAMAATSTLALVVIAVTELSGNQSVAFAMLAVVLLFAAFTVMQVVVTTVFMALSDQHQAGTDLTTYLAVFALGAIPGMVVSGFVAGSFGYGAGFLLAAVSCLLGLALSLAIPVRSDAAGAAASPETP